VPRLAEHVTGERRILGSRTPEVHVILDRYYHPHHHVGSPVDLARTVKAFEQLIPGRGGNVAALHMFMDWGFIIESDWRRKR
jgi:hypothetical protein